MSEILSVGQAAVRDNTIARKQIHTYSPYTSAFGNNDEIRIAIQSQDLYVLPSESYIAVDVNVTRKTGANHATVAGAWVSNYAQFLFSEIRYELNNIEIDRIKNPGVTCNLKKFTSSSHSEERICRLDAHYVGKALEARKYSFLIPLNFLFGFCEDYRKILMNAKHEIILVRNRRDIYSYTAATESFNLTVSKVQWKVPHIQLSDHAKLMMLRYLERKQTITVPYRSWDLYEMPQLPQSAKHIWTVKSSSQMSKPRFVFVALQTDRQLVSANSAAFDHCQISDIKLYLNSEYYPYENYDSNFTEGNYQDLYMAFLKIQKSYYNGHEGENPVNFDYGEYGASPIFAIDCSRTDESLLGGSIDIRLEINARENIPANTVAYCLIIYENQFEYSPFSNIVVRNTSLRHE